MSESVGSKKVTVYFRSSNGEFAKCQAERVDFPQIQFVTDSSVTYFPEGRIRRVVNLTNLPPATSETHAMAFAVLEGDEQAALMLADDVRDRHVGGDGFVSRLDYQRSLGEACQLLREWLSKLDECGSASPVRHRFDEIACDTRGFLEYVP